MKLAGCEPPIQTWRRDYRRRYNLPPGERSFSQPHAGEFRFSSTNSAPSYPTTIMLPLSTKMFSVLQYLPRMEQVMAMPSCTSLNCRNILHLPMERCSSSESSIRLIGQISDKLQRRPRYRLGG